MSLLDFYHGTNVGANSTESNSHNKPGEYMWFSDIMLGEEEGPPFKPMWL
jgi:hypothetical protein